MIRRTAAVLAAALLLAGGAPPVLAQGAFYQSTAAEAAGAPGTIIRSETMLGPTGAAATRVLYRSTGLNGEPIAVSGVVIVPQGAAPAGGRPIVAWAHPTSGVAPKCAPSLAIFLYQQIQGLREMIEAGYIVTATDYPGLGTPYTHPYLVGTSEGRAVLDSVRAARAAAGAGAGSRYAAWGHSQGGQAVLYAGLLSRSYAPELELAGIAAAAPATELDTLLRDDLATTGGNNLAAMTLWSWARIYNLPVDQVVKPTAMPAVETLASTCIESLVDILERRAPGQALDKSFLTIDDLPGVEPYKGLLEDNTPGPLPASIPVYLAQGTTDAVVRPSVTQSYFGELCRGGSRATLVMMPNVGHGLAAHAAANGAVRWIGDRFAGTPAPSTCN